jgi:N-methylhydantoinase A/oxoprolinase/acetone carboxylase beta subunit
VVRSWPTPGDHSGVERALAELADEAGAAVAPDAEVETFLDCRYAGQSHELTVATVDAFDDEHRRRNGYARPGAPIEIVALRARARQASPVSVSDLGPPQAHGDGGQGGGRRPTKGPAVLAEPDCTVWVPEGWTADVAADGSWVLSR